MSEPFTINFAGIEEPKTSSLPAGTYPARVFKLEFGANSENSKNPGETNLKVEFRVSAGEHEGRPLFRTFTFGEKSKPYFLKFCSATGRFSEEQLAGKQDITGREILALQGVEVAIKINQKRDANYGLSDGMKNEVKDVFSIKSEVGKAALVASKRDPLAPN